MSQITRECIADHTLEGEGGCQLWAGPLKSYGKARPYKVPIVPDGERYVSVRQVVARLHGVDASGQRIHMLCGCERCVRWSHMLVLGPSASMRRVMPPSGDARARAARTAGARRRRRLSDEQVQAVRADPRPLKAIAAELGVSIQSISRIRRGEAYCDVGGAHMWQQLLRRSPSC